MSFFERIIGAFRHAAATVEDDRTLAAQNSPDADHPPAEVTHPLRVLERLPERLWNRRAPEVENSVPALLGDTEVVDGAIFGPLVSDATPQYEIARVFASEKDTFVNAWRRVEADQLGFGTTRVMDGRYLGEGPRATGADLDVLLGQYGVSRPFGFTDGCYWRLAQLLLWSKLRSYWRLREIAALYTGTRPGVVEDIGMVTLTWPIPVRGEFISVNLWFGRSYWTDSNYDAPSALDMYLTSGDDPPGESFFGPASPQPEDPGLSLAQALNLVKPAGTRVRLVNPPVAGSTGCYGSKFRRPATARKFLA